MTKTEYNNWVTNTYLTANSYKNSGKINVLFNGDKTLVMTIDLTTMVTRSEIIKNDNTREAVAIAFTRLKGEKVPKITNAPEYERVPYGSNYYTIVIKDGRMFTDNYAEMNDEYDANCFETNNYFHTEERAKEVLDKIKMLLRLERLHDALCPDYKPLYRGREHKYFVSYSILEKQWEVFDAINLDKRPNVYFSTEEVAQQAADILNKKKSNESRKAN